MCDGPRRVPAPHGPAAALAASLGIVERTAGRIAMTKTVPGPWWEASRRVSEVRKDLLWPVPDGRFVRGFGRHREIIPTRNGPIRRGPRRIKHPGVDISAAAGAPIVAANDGLVLYSFNAMRGYGNAVLLLHADRSVTLYAHCRATYVFAGQHVRRGEIIAEVGATGLAHGPHLHFEWRLDGQPRDPAPRFSGRPPRTRERLQASAAR